MNEINNKILKLYKLSKKGDREAASELINLFYADVFRFCVYLTGNHELSKDFSQDIFLKALLSLDKLKEPLKIKSWLLHIAKNHFFDYKKSPKNQNKNIDDISEDKYSINHPDNETVHSVRRVLSQLDTEDQLLLLTVDMNGCSTQEAAEIIGVSESNLRVRLHRVRIKFKEIYLSSVTNSKVGSSTS